MKRVYHPTLNSWHDVAATEVEKWTKAGWKATKPSHVDDSEALPPAADPKPDPKAKPATTATPDSK